MKCKTNNCNNKHLAKGLCSKCYYRVKRGGTPEMSIKQLAATRICSVEGCGKPHDSKGLCAMHFRRLSVHGDPLYINPKCNRDGNATKRNRIRTAQWKKDNPKLNSSFSAARKRRTRQATPSWADLKAIRLFYFNCPEGHHVDHIIPLNNAKVCGLHVIENLQYLPIVENLKKSNKF